MNEAKSSTRIWSALSVVLVLVGLAIPVDRLQAKSYSLQRVEIRADILEDGSLRIEEARTYRFRGKFTWADYRLPLDAEKLGTVKDFTLREGTTYYEPSSDDEPGCYRLELTEDEFYVKWYYRARNETKTFVLSYLVADAVTVYTDVAEFYYKFVGEANEKRIDSVLVSIRLPQAADTTQVRAWAHGPLWGALAFREGEVQMHVSPLPAHKYWEARVLFPAEWVPEAKRRRSDPMKDAILAQEAEWARQANLERARELERQKEKAALARKALPIALVLSVTPLLVWIGLFLKHGRGFRAPYHLKIDSTIPENTSSVQANLVYHSKMVGGGTLMTALLGLARKGRISIEQLPQEKKSRWFSTNEPKFIIRATNSQSQGNNLEDFEADLLSFLFDTLGNGGDGIRLETLKKSSSKMQKWFKEWQKKVKAHYDKPIWEKQSVKATVISAVVSGLVIVAGAIILAVMGSPGALALVSGVVCLGLSFAILRYTPEFKLLYRRLQALSRYLRKYHFRNEDHASLSAHVEDYLVYAVALGVGSKAIEKLLQTVPSERHSYYFPWFLWHGHSASPAEFASSMSSFVSVATSSVSSAAGTGGGASGGGGGGGGGASGGAG